MTAGVPSVSERIDRGLRTRRLPPLAHAGEAATAGDGAFAAFSVSVERAHVANIRFRCTSCMTLVAYCQTLSESLAGAAVERGARFSAAELIAALPGVPAAHRDRAALAVTAWRSALVRSDMRSLSTEQGAEV